MSIEPQNDVAQNPGQVMEQMQNLDKSIYFVSDLLKELQARLDSILSVSKP